MYVQIFVCRDYNVKRCIAIDSYSGISFPLIITLTISKVITRTRELLEAANEQKRKCEEIVVERQQQLNKSEKTVKSISDELIKVR